MNHFDAFAIAPKFSLGQQVLCSITDPDEGLFVSPAIVSGLVFLEDHWNYALMFEGFNGSDFGWNEGELTPLEETSRASSDFPNSPIKTAQTIAA
ncbi:MAG: hypothetical protein ACRCU2_31430 [Planktothrix sp.]